MACWYSSSRHRCCRTNWINIYTVYHKLRPCSVFPVEPLGARTASDDPENGRNWLNSEKQTVNASKETRPSFCVGKGSTHALMRFVEELAVDQAYFIHHQEPQLFVLFQQF